MYKPTSSQGAGTEKARPATSFTGYLIYATYVGWLVNSKLPNLDTCGVQKVSKTQVAKHHSLRVKSKIFAVTLHWNGTQQLHIPLE